MIKLLPLKYIKPNMLYIGQPVIKRNFESYNFLSHYNILIGHIVNILPSEIGYYLPTIAFNFERVIQYNVGAAAIKVIDKTEIPNNILEQHYILSDINMTCCFVGKCKVYNKLYEQYNNEFLTSVKYEQNVLSHFNINDILNG